MNTVQRFTELKRKVEQLQRDADRAQGAMNQIKERLKEEYDLDSLKEAADLLLELETEVEELAVAFAEDLKTFEEEYGELL